MPADLYVANVGFMLHYIVGDYGFTSDIYYITCACVKWQKSCHGDSCVYVMTADSHVSRGSPLIGAARQSLPPGELVLSSSWLEELGCRFQRERMYFCLL